jgi:signal transduction histidine kinase
VIDTGIGLDKNRLDLLFGYADKKITYGTDGEKGIGLGLSLVNEFVIMNKGSVKVESEIGTGSCFTIKLPSTSK